MRGSNLISNEERKQVAARLREAKIENLGFYGFSAHLGESIGKCVRLVSGHYFLVEDGLNRLADLIEPEQEFTCRIIEVEPMVFICSKCGGEVEDWYLACPYCGCKVVEQ